MSRRRSDGPALRHDPVLEPEGRPGRPRDAALAHDRLAEERRRPVGDVRLRDDERVARRVRPGPERVARERRVVAGPGRLEVGQVRGVVHVAQTVGVHVADLDRMAVAERSLGGPEARAQGVPCTSRMTASRRAATSGDPTPVA